MTNLELFTISLIGGFFIGICIGLHIAMSREDVARWSDV